MRKLLLAIVLAGGCSFTIDPVGLPGASAPPGSPPSGPTPPTMMMPSPPTMMPPPTSPDLAESPDLAPPDGDCTMTGCPDGFKCETGKHGGMPMCVPDNNGE